MRICSVLSIEWAGDLSAFHTPFKAPTTRRMATNDPIPNPVMAKTGFRCRQTTCLEFSVLRDKDQASDVLILL